MILLENRAVILVSGADAESYLQGLITNDIKKAHEHNLLYAAMLTPQGKILFDFLIQKTPDGFLLDILASRAEALIKRLNMYKLRSAVEIKLLPDFKVYHSANAGLPDPRNNKIGNRLITNARQQTTADFTSYEAKRIEAGLAESEDLLPEQDFPLQASFENMNGVSFDKGCYVGQEVTARTKYKGNIKYAFYKITSDAPIIADGKTIRSASGNNAIAHLEVTDLPTVNIGGAEYNVSH